MARQTKKKQSYGGCNIDNFSPARAPGWPKAINVVLGFEDALKLQLALQARLMEMNRMNRSTREGKAAAVNLCVYTNVNRITVNPAKIRRNTSDES